MARRTIRAQWADLPDDVLDDVQLIVAELVSNAVRHCRPQIELHLRAEPFAVNVGVLDRRSAQPPITPHRPVDTATSGRGLLLVDQLARRWGIAPLDREEGKAVWATVSLW